LFQFALVRHVYIVGQYSIIYETRETIQTIFATQIRINNIYVLGEIYQVCVFNDHQSYETIIYG